MMMCRHRYEPLCWPSCKRKELGTMFSLRLFLLRILLRREVNEMAVVYATLIIKGRKTLEQVPALLRTQVEQLLEDLEVKV